MGVPDVHAAVRIGDLALKGTVIHERLVADHGFTGNYQRVKMFLAEARPRIAAALEESDDNPLRGLHRLEVVPGAQAQVGGGDEGDLLAHVGIPRCIRSTWCCRIPATRSAVSPPAWI